MMLPRCAAEGCENLSDPRWYAHHLSGGIVMICDGHAGTPCKGDPCTCPVIRKDAEVRTER
jgi:hypothetical protein